MTDEEKIAALRKRYHGKGPVKSDSTMLGGIPVKASLGFQIHDKDGNLIVDTEKDDDNG